MALVAHDEPPAPQLGERYGDLVESLTDLARTLTETESVRDTLQSILALALRSIPGCHAASITVLDDKEQPSTVAATDKKHTSWTAASTSCTTGRAWTPPGVSRSVDGTCTRRNNDGRNLPAWPRKWACAVISPPGSA